MGNLTDPQCRNAKPPIELHGGIIWRCVLA